MNKKNSSKKIGKKRATKKVDMVYVEPKAVIILDDTGLHTVTSVPLSKIIPKRNGQR